MEIEVPLFLKDEPATGRLKPINGNGSHKWQLFIKNYYIGELSHSPHFGWQFSTTQMEGKDLGKHFASFLPIDQQNNDAVCNCFLCTQKIN